MTASQKPKTPTMTLPVASSMSVSEIGAFCKRASRLTLSQLVDNVVVEESLTTEDDDRRRNFRVTINLFPRDQYEPEYQTSRRKLLNALGAAFGFILKKEIQVELKKFNAVLKAQLSSVGKGQAAPRERGVAEHDDDEDAVDEEATGGGGKTSSPGEELPPRDDASEVGDGDAEDKKRIRQTRQMSYESDSEDSEDDDAASRKIDDEDDTTESEAAFDGGEGDIVDAVGLGGAKWEEWIQTADQELSARCSYVVPGSFSFEHKSRSRCQFDLNVCILVLLELGLPTEAFLFTHQFQAETPKLLLVDIIERSCVKTIVHHIPNISRCLHVKDDDPKAAQTMMTEGSNLAGIWKFAIDHSGDHVQLNEIRSNDVYAMLTSYGVEAARLTIVHEIQGIFAAYGIAVDSRHVELIADYMVRFLPCSTRHIWRLKSDSATDI